MKEYSKEKESTPGQKAKFMKFDSKIQGEFKNDKMNGKGIIIWPNG